MAVATPKYLCILVLLVLGKSCVAARNCYTSIFSFGDSLSDNGNLVALSAPKIPHQGRLPNGETYFGHPSGRCCDGRLIVDLIAQSFGLPFPAPYVAVKDYHFTLETEIDWFREFLPSLCATKPTQNFNVGIKKENYRADFCAGLNFAVAGARALDSSFFDDRGIAEPITNVTLRTQLDWFRDLLPSLCGTKADCWQYLQGSLIIMGEIGGNDYNHALLQGRGIEEVKSFVPLVVDAITSAITAMIEFGAVNFIVPGNLPFGCAAVYLTYFQNSSKNSDYDEFTGCINWLNDLAKYHNHLLQIELNHLRKHHPNATIVYADFYNSAMRFYRSPEEFGFAEGRLSACCGAGGPYNFNSSVGCGDPPTTSCNDPSKHICWDGLHLTEAANKWVVQGLLEGPYSNPPLNTICPSLSSDAF